MSKKYESAQYSKGKKLRFLLWIVVIDRLQAVFDKLPIPQVRECLEIVFEDITNLQAQQPNHDINYVGSDRNDRATIFINQQ